MNSTNITGTSSPVVLEFDPEFLPQFSGTYECIGPNVREAVMITTGMDMYDIIMTVDQINKA